MKNARLQRNFVTKLNYLSVHHIVEVIVDLLVQIDKTIKIRLNDVLASNQMSNKEVRTHYS